MRSSQAPGSYVTGGLVDFGAFAKSLTPGGKAERMAQETMQSRLSPEVPGRAQGEEIESTPEGQVFRANSRLVELYATVTDANGRYLDDLTQDLFNIQDAGKPANIIAFESRTSEVSVALLLDTTGSMLNALPALKSAAIHLIDELRPADSVAVYSFNSSVQELQ